MSKPPYTTRLQAGLGLIAETRRLLALWEPGMGTTALRRAALASGEFPSITARRLENIVVEAFAPRYLVDDGYPARLLKTLLGTLPEVDIRQLMFLYTCRANPILADFVRERYWPRYAAGSTTMSKTEAVDFIRRAMDRGLTTRRWADSTVERVSGYLPGALADFGLLGAARLDTRPVQSFRPTPLLSSFLAHDLHVHGVGDQALLAHEDWRLFGLDGDDVLGELKQLALRGELILQSAGSLVHIGWKHQTLEALADEFATH